MKKLSAICDYVIFSLALSSLSFGFTFAKTKNLFLSFIAAAIVFILFSLAFYAQNISKAKKFELTTQTKRKLESFKSFLLTKSYDELFGVFARLFAEKPQFVSERISILSKDEEVFLRFDESKLSERDFFALARSSDRNKLRFFCLSAPSEKNALSSFFPEKEISFCEVEELFSLLSENGLLPDLPDCPLQKKPAFREFLQSFVDPRKKRRYCLLGLFFAAFSFVSPYKLLYRIFAACLVAFSVALLFVEKKINR